MVHSRLSMIPIFLHFSELSYIFQTLLYFHKILTFLLYFPPKMPLVLMFICSLQLFFCPLKYLHLAEVLLYTMAHPCGHLDDECAKLQVIKGVHIDDQGVLLQDTSLVGDAVQMFGEGKHKLNRFIQLISKYIVS